MRTAHVLLVVALGIAPLGARQEGHPKEPHQHAEAAKMANPVPSDASSIAAGKKAFADYCAACHGDTGKGDGPMAAFTGDPLPSDLTDADWKHGSSDGEIFVVIRDGSAPKFEMKGFKGRMTDTEMWNVVNFVRSIGPQKTPPKK